jgi:hypothetical protein
MSRFGEGHLSAHLRQSTQSGRRTKERELNGRPTSYGSRGNLRNVNEYLWHNLNSPKVNSICPNGYLVIGCSVDIVEHHPWCRPTGSLTQISDILALGNTPLQPPFWTNESSKLTCRRAKRSGEQRRNLTHRRPFAH